MEPWLDDLAKGLALGTLSRRDVLKQALVSRCTQIGSSALSVQTGGGKLDMFDKLER